MAALPGRDNRIATRAFDWLAGALTITGESFEERVVERALKIQIGFLLFLALVAPFGGMELGAELSLFLLAQAALTRLALIRVRARDMFLGGGLYLVLAVVTFVEAKRYSGFVGAVFALEAVLSLVATWYIFVLLRDARGKEREGKTDG
ncbi:MAG: hypothetical protein AAF074_01125 [Pseudomonadota bacterium]